MSEPHTGGMVAFLPAERDAATLAVPNGEPQDQIHVTIAYLGDDVTRWAATQRRAVLDAVLSATYAIGPIKARAFAHATFNPDGGPAGDRDPCAVYLIGDCAEITQIQESVMAGLHAMYLPDQHTPYVPHLTAGYGLTAADLNYTGPITLDRVWVAFGEDRTEIPLAASSPALDRPTRAAYASDATGPGLLQLAGPSTSARQRMAKHGTALKDGSYPIPDRRHLALAMQAFGRCPKGKRAALVSHIRKQARALGAIGDPKVQRFLTEHASVTTA